MTAKHKCSAKTPDMYGVPNIHPCRRSGTKERDGRWYCWQHDPEYIARKAEERRAAWEAEGDGEAAKYARIARNARLGALITEETADLLEKMATENVTVYEERKVIDLVAQIREVLNDK